MTWNYCFGRLFVGAPPVQAKLIFWEQSHSEDFFLCNICHYQLEIRGHLFFQCFLPKFCGGMLIGHLMIGLWRLNRWVVYEDLTESHPASPDWWPRWKGFILQSALILDTLWWTRNKAVHEGINPDPLQIFKLVTRRFMKHCQAWEEKEIPLNIRWVPRWVPQPEGTWKLKFEAACRNHCSYLAVVCRTRMGLFYSNPLVAEMKVALFACHVAGSLSNPKLMFKGDSMIESKALWGAYSRWCCLDPLCPSISLAMAMVLDS